jgi:hypothetical protein
MKIHWLGNVKEQSGLAPTQIGLAADEEARIVKVMLCLRIPFTGLVAVALISLAGGRIAPACRAAAAGAPPGAVADFLAGRFQWAASAPLIGPAAVTDHGRSLKDPSIVFSQGRWHLYATLRTDQKPAQMEYLSFVDWRKADAAARKVIALDDTYHCAPQVFYFRPQKRWYLIYQWTDRTPGTGYFGPAYSTLTDVGKPETLTKPVMLFPKKMTDHWIDFWVICDATYAYLFYTGDDGKFWRSRTKLADFPRRWSDPVLVLQDQTNEFFEAAHIYRLKNLHWFLNLVEAIGPGNRRYYKAFLADRLDGEWRPIAGSWERPFASANNVRFKPGVAPWTDSISHGELLREGNDETLTVDLTNLRFLFQGCSSQDRAGKNYGQYPWRLGLLEPAR